MKRLAVTLLLLAFAVGTGICTMLTVRHEVGIISEKLEELRQEEIRPELVLEQWEKSSRKLSFFIRHADLKEVSHSITEICTGSEREPMQFEIAEMYLERLVHEESLELANIF